jgi:hypothetical protein
MSKRVVDNCMAPFEALLERAADENRGTITNGAIISVLKSIRPRLEELEQRADATAVVNVVQKIGDDLMQEAWELTNGDRHQAYGTAEEVFRAYGLIYTGFLAHKLKPGVVIDAADVALLMTGLKLAREANNPKRDNVVDAHGYLSLLARIRGWIKRAA